MATLTEEEQAIVSALKVAHEDVAAFKLKTGDLIVVRKCNQAERARFVDRLSKKDKEPMSTTLKELTLSCVVHPSRDEARALLDRYPALYDKLANKAYELAEGEIEEVGKD